MGGLDVLVDFLGCKDCENGWCRKEGESTREDDGVGVAGSVEYGGCEKAGVAGLEKEE